MGAKEVIIGVLAILFGIPIIMYIIGFSFMGTTNMGFQNMGGTSSSVTMPGFAPQEKSYDSSDYAYNESGPSRTIAPMPPIVGKPPASTADLPTEKKIIQNGSLDLLVAKAEVALAAIAEIAKSNEGFVENSNVYEVSEGVKAGSVTVRVPAESFLSTIEEIKTLAVKVKRENTSSEDVTAQYVDLEAQLKNFRAEEAQYQEIMERAVKIQDVLDVASKLAEVRGRIERTQGQLNYLSRQVGMSTISVSLTSEAEVEVFGIIWRPLTVLKQALKNLLNDLAAFVNFLIYFLFKLPVIILRLGFAALIIWILWKIGRKAVQKMHPPIQ